MNNNTVHNARRKKAAGMIAFLLAVIFCCAAPLTACRPSSPDKLFIYAEKAMHKDIMADLYKARNKMPETVSTDMDISLDLNGMPVGEQETEAAVQVLKKLKLSMKLSYKPEDMLLYAGIGYGGSDILTAAATRDKNGIGIYMPQLDENYYVIRSLSSFIHHMNNEQAAPDTEFKPVKNLETALLKCLRRYSAHTTACVTKQNTQMEKNQQAELSILGSTVEKCSILTFTPAKDDLIKLFENIGSEMKNDKKLALAIASYARKDIIFGIMLTSFIEEKGYEGSNDYERVLSGLNETSEDLLDNAEEYASSILADGEISLRACVGKNGAIVKETLLHGSRKLLTFEIGNTKKNDAAFGVSFYIEDEGEFRFAVESEEVKKGIFALNIAAETPNSLGVNGIDRYFIKSDCIDTNRKSALGIPYGEIEISSEIAGAASSDDENPGKIIFSVSAAENGGTDHKLRIESVMGGIGINFHSTDEPCTAKKPDASEIVDITEYTPEQTEELLNGIKESLSAIIMSLALSGIFGW